MAGNSNGSLSEVEMSVSDEVILETPCQAGPSTGDKPPQDTPTGTAETPRFSVSVSVESANDDNLMDISDDLAKSKEMDNYYQEPIQSTSYLLRPGTSKDFSSSSNVSSDPNDVIAEKVLEQDLPPKSVDSLLKELASRNVTIISDSVIVDAHLQNKQVVNIYTEDSGPHWYDIQGNILSKPIAPKKIPVAFERLPIIGRPSCRLNLKEFQHDRLKEYVGSGLTDEEFAKVEQFCSGDRLRTGNEIKMSVDLPMVYNIGLMQQVSPATSCPGSPNSQHVQPELCMVKKYKMRVARDAKNTYSRKLKYRGIRLMPVVSESDNTELSQDEQLEPGKDLLYRVRIYRPFTYYDKYKPQCRVRHSVFSRDVLILGRQKLSELRDRIVCANDVDMGIDISHRIDEPPLTTAKELFPSGFLFINNVFYTDTRPGCTDLTERLRRWAAGRRGGAFQLRDMCAVSVGELVLKLGHPEVYVHRGNCEHLFTFSEIRLLNATDPLGLSTYPCHTAISQNQTVYCTTCAEFGAKWMVTECERVPFDPAFFCETCLKLYLYKDGQKIGNFKAYSYRGNEINVLKPQG